ncbi:HpcH/HpaI aldolase/citrate lyase family protein [Methyloraptor flagellatus]|uniref:CoA ester lyase n=1 Tax=Methyloraptor flagellatus TaxID=3162530 RepID=A0AAU7XCP3_9HYPH
MRSLLFVPADSPRKLEKALASGADVLIVDLEDSVAAGAKAAARASAAAFLREVAATTERPKLYVRINAFVTGLVDADLDAVLGAGAEGIMLPKAGGGQDVTRLDAKIAVHEAIHGLGDGAIRVIAIATEMASALFQMGSYRGASRRLAGLAWGAEDLAADIGVPANRDATGAFLDPFRLARTLALLGAVGAEVVPIDGVYTAFRDLDGLRRECAEAVRDGFTAKMAIHPDQVAVINDAFTPSVDAVERARRVVEAFAAAGDAGVIGLDGAMLDRPHLRQAERLLARAASAGVA